MGDCSDKKGSQNKSAFGHVFKLYGDAVAKGSRLQSVTDLSTTEGKDIAAGAAPSAAIFLYWHFTDLQKPVGPARDPMSNTLLVLGDNQAVLFLLEKRLRPQHLIYYIAAKCYGISYQLDGHLEHRIE